MRIIGVFSLIRKNISQGKTMADKNPNSSNNAKGKENISPAKRIDNPSVPSETPIENLVAYLDQELSAEEIEEVELQLGKNPVLRKEVNSLKQAWDLLDFLPLPEPSPEFAAKTISQSKHDMGVEPPHQENQEKLTTSKLTNSSKTSEVADLSHATNSAEIPTLVNQYRSSMALAIYKKNSSAIIWGGIMVIAVLFGWIMEPFLKSYHHPQDNRSAEAKKQNEEIAFTEKDLRLLERLKYYRYIDDIEFLQALAKPELFGE